MYSVLFSFSLFLFASNRLVCPVIAPQGRNKTFRTDLNWKSSEAHWEVHDFLAEIPAKNSNYNNTGMGKSHIK